MTTFIENLNEAYRINPNKGVAFYLLSRFVIWHRFYDCTKLCFVYKPVFGKWLAKIIYNSCEVYF